MKVFSISRAASNFLVKCSQHKYVNSMGGHTYNPEDQDHFMWLLLESSVFQSSNTDQLKTPDPGVNFIKVGRTA